MAMNDAITLEIKGRGQYQTTAHHLSELVAEYLPASIESLRKVLREFSGDECEGHYDDDDTLMSGSGIGEATRCDGSCVRAYGDLQTVIECLMVIAEYRGYATN
ncbi:hypothetical protein [Streptomyces sp. WZ-12]|uniref:hypothetical protein n=1 Tax=Streptomyces sp. WZ-12 TaxID=3030210 RepID=UPI0023818F8D|nr:hypothetical protein [Streptomyces sp. WZ-12]